MGSAGYAQPVLGVCSATATQCDGMLLEQNSSHESNYHCALHNSLLFIEVLCILVFSALE